MLSHERSRGQSGRGGRRTRLEGTVTRIRGPDPLHRTELLAMLLEKIIYLYSTPPLAQRHTLLSRKRVQLTWRDANMSAQLKWRFAGGSTLVVIIPEFIRVLRKRSTIYFFTLEQGSHENARTGSPEAPELRRVKSHSRVVPVYTKHLTTHLLLQNVPSYSAYFLSSIVTWVFPAAPQDTPRTWRWFFMLYPQTVPPYPVQVAKNDAVRYNSPAECYRQEETHSSRMLAW